MPYLMQPYDDALQEILDRGIKKADRTGVGCVSVAGLHRKYDLSGEAFPIVTRRRVFPKAVFAELIWFLSGSTMNQDLEKLGAKFWGKWCDESNPKYVSLRKRWGYSPGDFGPVYAHQLRHFGADYVQYRAQQADVAKLKVMHDRLSDLHAAGKDEDFIMLLEEMGSRHKVRGIREGYIKPQDVLDSYKDGMDLCPELGGFDQLAYMIDILKNDPFGSNGRRCMFSLWNPNDLDKQALPPCHFTYQAIADGDGGLTGILTQRSCDWVVGVCANIQFYSAFTIMLAQQADMKPREFIHNTNDSHVYLNQLDQAREYLSRSTPDSPKLAINMAKDIYSYKVEDFVLSDYAPLEKIDVPVAV